MNDDYCIHQLPCGICRLTQIQCYKQIFPKYDVTCMDQSSNDHNNELLEKAYRNFKDSWAKAGNDILSDRVRELQETINELKKEGNLNDNSSK